MYYSYDRETMLGLQIDAQSPVVVRFAMEITDSEEWGFSMQHIIIPWLPFTFAKLICKQLQKTYIPSRCSFKKGNHAGPAVAPKFLVSSFMTVMAQRKGWHLRFPDQQQKGDQE